MWDAKNGQPIGTPMRGHEGAVTKLAFTPDGTRIVTSSYDRTLRLWDGGSGQPIGEPMRGHTNTVFGFAFSRMGRALPHSASTRRYGCGT
jgi:WD40 repeat protein